MKIFRKLLICLTAQVFLLTACASSGMTVQPPTGTPGGPTDSFFESDGSLAVSSPGVLSPTDPPATSDGPSVSPFLPSGQTPSSEPTPPPKPSKTQPEDFQPFYPDEKVIAFTFDDGPDWVTPRVLDLIDGTDDRVTFFITGYMMDMNAKYKDYVKRASDMGCDVGLHTYNHKNLFYASTQTDAPEELIQSELGDIDKLYTEITGKKTYLLRPPGGSLNKKRNYGYACILWSVDSEDWKSWSDRRAQLTSSNAQVKAKATEEAANEIATKVLATVKPGDIVLMHDVYETSVIAFEKIYTALKAQGYKFVTVSDLLNIDPEQYTGWYFHETGRSGVNGSMNLAQRTDAQSVAALPPEKIF